MSGGGCILRDDSGHLIWASAEFYGIQTNMVAEARALLSGLKKCVNEGRHKLEIESDSLVLVQILNSKVGIP